MYVYVCICVTVYVCVWMDMGVLAVYFVCLVLEGQTMFLINIK